MCRIWDVSICVAGMSRKADFLWPRSCPYSFGRLEKFPSGNYSFPSVPVIFWNRIGRHVAVYHLTVICALLKFVPSFCQHTLFVFCLLSFSPFFASFLFPCLVLGPIANDIREHLSTGVMERSLPKIANDVCEHLYTIVGEHHRSVLTVREWLKQGPVLDSSDPFDLLFPFHLLHCAMFSDMRYVVRRCVWRFQIGLGCRCRW